LNSRIICGVTKNEELDLVEGSTPSKMEEEATDTAGACHVEALTPTAREKEKFG
jgi:hypothetical protein